MMTNYPGILFHQVPVHRSQVRPDNIIIPRRYLRLCRYGAIPALFGEPAREPVERRSVYRRLDRSVKAGVPCRFNGLPCGYLKTAATNSHPSDQQTAPTRRSGGHPIIQPPPVVDRLRVGHHSLDFGFG